MRFLVTAGPTREFFDPVRFLSNRSSGKMGYAVAESAWGRGHTVTLVSGPVAIPAPSGVTLVNVTSAQEMLEAVQGHVAQCDVLVMCAAVADWRPKTVATTKIKKNVTQATPPVPQKNVAQAFLPVQHRQECLCYTLELEPTPDILLTIKPLKGEKIFVGFAAETDDLLAEARRKLETKGLDLIVANDVTQPDAGFDTDTNRVTFLECGKVPQALPLMSKKDVATRIVEWCESVK